MRGFAGLFLVSMDWGATMHDQLLSKKEIACRLGKTPKTISRWAREGKLPEPAKTVGIREYWFLSQITIFENYRTFEDITLAG